MVHSRVHSFSAENPSTQAKSAQFASRPAIQSQPTPRTFSIQAETETEAFDRGIEAVGSHFAHIPVHAPDRPAPTPMQPPLAIPRSHPIAPIQAKLTIGQPNDRYEQEADRVAAQVVNQIHTPQVSQQGETLQRKETREGEDDKLQMKPLLQSPSEGISASPELEAEIGRSRSGGQSLAEPIRRPMERTFGTDFSQVKVHTDAQADQLNRSIQAKAFTTGQDMFFRQGAYQPGSRAGQELIAHELTHVVQQHQRAEYIQRDVVEDIVLKGRDKAELKSNLASCISKFKAAIKHARDTATIDEKSDLNEGLASDGRDAFFYRRRMKRLRKIWWESKHGLEGDLNRWTTKWSVGRTGGLLSDLGLVLKDVPLDSFSGVEFEDIANDYLITGSDHVRGRNNVGRSDWHDDITTSRLKGHAGPSSTTTQLLRVISSIGKYTPEWKFTPAEVEAMMVALVKFWKGGLKRKFGGGHHTAAEVWAPYTGYLETQKNDE